MKNHIFRVIMLACVVLTSTALYSADFTVTTHPRLLINQQAVEHAKQNIANHEWARKNSEALIAFADKYETPRRREFIVRRVNSQWPSMGYTPKSIEELFTVGLAWTLTQKAEYLEKMKTFVLEACDPTQGYISVGAATTGVEVHEGGFFLYLTAICDILYSQEGLITPEQKSNIESAMRKYLNKAKDEMHPNGIMNHQASTNAAAVMVSMFLQDKELFDHFVERDGGLYDHIGTGVMPDGWWFEGTINYCYLVTDITFRMAQVFQNNGMDLYHAQINSRVMDKDFHNAPDEFTGMKFAVWGPEPKPYRTLHDMAMAYYPMMDEDGVVLATNDSNTKEPSEYYELAYKEYGDKELAWVLSKTERDSWIALFYGVGELPKVDDPRTKSVTIPNIGLTALRSQNPERQGTEQLQAYVKYGSHGGWHGHFDRVSLQALDKYSHKYFGTEMCWFGYGSAQYKELVQSTVTHNMVMVDEMQQEAVPSTQPVMFAGEMMQLSVIETRARWRTIPRFNIEKFPPWNDTDYATEPILQRRLSLVTDDYLLMVDYISGEQEHQYDCLVHPLGFVGVEGAQKVGALQDKVSEDENSPYKYFSSCQWYKGGKESVKFRFNDSGYGLDLHIAYPKKSDIILAHYPTTGKVSHGIRNNPERRTVAARVKAKQAVFITALEPYKSDSVIASIKANSEEQITITLKSGEVHIIKVSGLKGDAKDIKVSMESKSKDGSVRTESN